MPPIKVKYKGEIHEINWTGSKKPSKEELRLAISNDILSKEAPPPLNDKYQPPELEEPPNPAIFQPKNKIQRFVEKFEPDAFDEPRRDRSMFSIDTDKVTDYASRAPKPLQKPLAIAGSLASTGAELFSDPESVLTPGMFGAYKRGLPKHVPDLSEPAPSMLEIPDTPPDFANVPIRRTDSTYGITPRPTSDPLLSHVPERLQPPGTTQQYFENILPSTIRERVKTPIDIPESIPPDIPNPLGPSVGRSIAEELKGSTLEPFVEQAADTGLPNLPEPGIGDYKPPSKWSQIMNFTKSAKTTGDLSAPLRQGIGLIHRKEYWQSLKPMMKSLWSEEGYKKVVQEMESSPVKDAAIHAGLAIHEREENIASNLTEAIPSIAKMFGKSDKMSLVSRASRASNRAYDAFVKKLRMDTFENMLKDKINSGDPIDPNFTKNIAEVINTATGRGTLGKLNKNADLLNNAFFSPRFISSRIQMLNPQYYYKLDKASRTEAIKSTLAIMSFGTTLASLAKLAGAEVEDDTTSSDYGKIKVGDVRFDPYAGLQQYVVLFNKIAQQQQKSPITGNIRKFDGKFGSPTGLGAIGRFVQSKLNPMVGLGAKLLQGTDYAGQPLNVPVEVLKTFIPMITEDTTDFLMNEPEMLPAMIPSALGMGVQRFDQKEPDKSVRPSRSNRPSRKARK